MLLPTQVRETKGIGNQPIEVPYETGQHLKLSQYQGYNGSLHGKPFGGYGVGQSSADAVHTTP